MTKQQTAARWTWKNERVLMGRLHDCQNSGAFDHQDIMTIVAFMDSHDELVKHVEASERIVASKGLMS